MFSLTGTVNGTGNTGTLVQHLTGSVEGNLPTSHLTSFQEVEHGKMELSLSLQWKSMLSSFAGLKPADFHCKDKNSLK